MHVFNQVYGEEKMYLYAPFLNVAMTSLYLFWVFLKYLI